MTAVRVLVVDDEPFIRTTVSMLLKLEGFDVRSAADGDAGLAAAHDFLPKIILSDVNMPHLNGYALLAAVRAAPELARTLFVLLTGEADTDGLGGDAGVSADARLSKPFTRDRLLGMVRSLSA